jgi:cell wall-associated NlpC family hydrolase
MSGKALHATLLLCALLLLFTQCEVIRDLTTDRNTPTPRTTPTTTSSGSSSGSTAERVSDREARLRQDIVSYAKQQLGTKYKYAGKSPRTGFDCSGFTYYVMNNFNVDLSPSSRAQENQGKKIKVSDAKTGDLIFFRRSKTGAVFHVALVVSNDREGLKVIHSTSRGVVIDNLYASSYWKPKISTARDVL